MVDIRSHENINKKNHSWTTDAGGTCTDVAFQNKILGWHFIHDSFKNRQGKELLELFLDFS